MAKLNEPGVAKLAIQNKIELEDEKLAEDVLFYLLSKGMREYDAVIEASHLLHGEDGVTGHLNRKSIRKRLRPVLGKVKERLRRIVEMT